MSWGGNVSYLIYIYMISCKLFIQLKVQLSYVTGNRMIVMNFFFKEPIISCHIGELREKLAMNHISCVQGKACGLHLM
jgi:hypothetical protein